MKSMAQGAMPVALVGMGCRFPSGVTDPAGFWQALEEGRDAITEIPRSRIDMARFHDDRPATPGRIMTRWGGFLGDLDTFDAAFFGISPREAERMDPAQRLVLETAWEGLEDAGIDPLRLDGSDTGVFVGQWLSDFEARLFADPELVDFYMTTGSGRYATSGRLSYLLGLRGPSLTVDTACSSSLVAVHLAVQSLRRGECTLALAGGVNVILQPHISIAYSQSRMMAPDGRCKFGDAAGDGYVRSEGAGMMVLKRLEQAIADGDRVYAVIRGSAVNNDGRSSGFMGRPSQEGQEAVLRQAYRDAGVKACDVGYVEAHGTGTRAGDPVELGALGTVLGEGRRPDCRARVGSVKTNFGHTEGAAGVAGLIKAALALHHGRIPSSLHCHQLNPAIDWSRSPCEIVREAVAWTGPDRLAGVSGYGISGTNAHVVLQSAPAQRAPAVPTAAPPTLPGRHALLVLSARSGQALRQLAQRYAERLAHVGRAELDDICWSAATRRAGLEWRVAFIAADAAELAHQLAAYAAGEPSAPVAEGMALAAPVAPPVFVVPGQGGQWIGMARELMAREPVFRDALLACNQAARPHMDTSILAALGADESLHRPDRIEVIQPTLLAVAIAYARWLASLGINAGAVVGHSMGEVGAAHLAGVLDLDQAMRIVCRRSALMGRTSGHGAMAMVDLPMNEAQQSLREREALLSVAASNSPRSSVISGDPAALAGLMTELEADHVFCRLVNVDVASHSPQMDESAAALTQELAGMVPLPARVPIHSTVLARRAEGHEFDAAYWGRNLRQPVRFNDAVMGLLDQGFACFVELGPHPVLAAAIRQSAQSRGLSVVSVACGRRETSDTFTALGVVAGVWVAGLPMDWSKVLPKSRSHVALPTYPWQRERHWCDAAEPRAGSTALRADTARADRHPLLERIFRPAGKASTCWESALVPGRFPYLPDHRVRGAALFPAAGYCEVALAAARESRAQAAWTLRDIEFHAAWILQPATVPELQVDLNWSSQAEGRFDIHGFAGSEAGERWERRASGRLVARDADPPQRAARDLAFEGLDSVLSHDEIYARLAAAGLDYGPAFLGIREMRLGAGQAVATVQLDTVSLDPQAHRYGAFPPLLDCLLQVMALAVVGDDDDAFTPIPVRIGRLDLADRLPLDRAIRVSLTLHPGTTESAVGDIDLHELDGHWLGRADDVGFVRLRRAAPPLLDDVLLRPEWSALPPAPAALSALPTAIGPVLLVADSLETARPLLAALTTAQVHTTLCLGADAADTESAALIGAFRDLASSTPGARAHIVHLSALGGPAPEEAGTWIEDAWQLAGDSLVTLARHLNDAGFTAPPRLWLVTQCAVSTAAEEGRLALGQAALWGLGRVWANEQPALDVTLVDLDRGPLTAMLPVLVPLLRALPAERQLALRSTRWLALRLPRIAAPATCHAAALPASFEAAMSTPGVPDRLQWHAADRREPQAHEVEIEVAATGLNFMNLMSVLGIYPGYKNGHGPLGIECAGCVLRVGSAVQHVSVGDEVIAITPDCLARHAIADAALVVRRPAALPADSAAGVPIAFLTAWYALHHLARLERGERVLIHSAAGGVGLAALQVAKLIGAEVFATAGTDSKRALLRSMGVRHVFDSHHTDFADGVLAASGGMGVDVVLNSLAAEAIAAGLRCLAPYGRFIELGKRDIYGGGTIDLQPFCRSLSYFAVDLDRMMRERAPTLGRLLRDVVGHFDAGAFQPLPTRVYAADALAAAFKDLMPGTHVGKHVIALQPGPVHVHGTPRLYARVRSDGCYVVTGGLGALGFEVARWLARRGAGRLMLIGRSAPSDDAQRAIREIEAAGTEVITACCDVASREALAAVLQRGRDAGMPLRGVFHAAGVLADAPLTEMTPQTLRLPRDAKVLGAWNLDRLTAADNLDCFVVFSSIASLFGTPGQGNYAAANAFLDALAHDRHARGVPGLSINFGPVADIGLAASSALRSRSLHRLGFDGIASQLAIEAIDRLVPTDLAQAVCAAFDAERWHAAMHREGAIGLVEAPQDAAGRPATAAAEPSWRERLLAAPAGPPRRAAMDAALKAEVAEVLRLAPTRVPSDRPLKTLGLDSLMALELRNRLERRTGLSLSPTLVWNYPTVGLLGAHLGQLLQAPLDAAEPAPSEAVDEDLGALLDDLDKLSDEEVRELLENEGGV